MFLNPQSCRIERENCSMMKRNAKTKAYNKTSHSHSQLCSSRTWSPFYRPWTTSSGCKLWLCTAKKWPSERVRVRLGLDWGLTEGSSSASHLPGGSSIWLPQSKLGPLASGSRRLCLNCCSGKIKNSFKSAERNKWKKTHIKDLGEAQWQRRKVTTITILERSEPIHTSNPL